MNLKHYPTDITFQFGKRLRELRSDRSQHDFAEELMVTQSKISDWERGKSFPRVADINIMLEKFGSQVVRRLLSLEIVFSSPDNSVTWIENIPANVTNAEKEIIDIGIGLWHAIMLDKYDIPTIKTKAPFNKYNLAEIYHAFKSVVRKEILQITQIRRNAELEQKLRDLSQRKGRLFPHLKEVIVVDVPDTDATLLMTEFLVHFAVHEVLQKVRGIRSIGISSGYTMLRLGESLALNPSLVNNVRWIPLMGYPAERISVTSANHIVLTLASRYGGTPFQLPFDATNNEENDNQAKVVFEEAAALPLAFVTVNGAGQRSGSASPDAHLRELRHSDYFDPGKTHYFYNELKKEGVHESFSGEILGYMLDKDGQQIGSANFQKLWRSRVRALPLANLYNIASSGHVWLLAARQYKAEPTLTALRKGFVSALIIDNTIAKYLIDKISG